MVSDFPEAWNRGTEYVESTSYVFFYPFLKKLARKR